MQTDRTFHTVGLGFALLAALILTASGPATAQTPTFTTLHSFNGDGAHPQAGLVVARDGNLYGTTGGGGASDFGTVFRITTAGALTTLHSFNYSDGNIPCSALIQGKDGNLYGTTSLGGANGDGAVFRITIAGALTVLHSFHSTDGFYPYGGLIQARDGALYGTTWGGGAGGAGTMFRITTAGALTTVFNFTPYDGEGFVAGMVQASDGALYGTTYQNNGTVFRITTAGALTPLYSFSGPDGDGPYAALIQGKDGNLYGTCSAGGANGSGTVFKITTSGALTTLYSFSDDSASVNSDGAIPVADLIQGKDGNLYGTTSEGGANGEGTVFKITTGGALTTLHSFSARSSTGTNTDGAFPRAGLIQGKDGNFYGTTLDGGASSAGTVFKLTMIPVITSFSPASGPVGTSITVTGANFTDATAVNLGKIPAAFTINSDTSLTLTVPSPGAASAKISVVNPFGKATSSRSFIMIPIITSFSPAKGKVGASVILKGVNFTGATAVKIGAVSASFTINSDTSLTLTVPTGAVNAKISIANSFGTGVSAKGFTVIP